MKITGADLTIEQNDGPYFPVPYTTIAFSFVRTRLPSTIDGVVLHCAFLNVDPSFIGLLAYSANVAGHR